MTRSTSAVRVVRGAEWEVTNVRDARTAGVRRDAHTDRRAARAVPGRGPTETTEWLQSFDAVVDELGRARGRFLLLKLLERAREQNIGIPSLTTTDFINTIPPEREPRFPGNEQVEERIRQFVRWNAAVMVHRAELAHHVGGHIGTYASAAMLYEIGFNHFFRGKDHPGGGDQVYFQGHASPGVYSRAFLEGRLDEEDLDSFRREVDQPGLSSYPHPRLMPDFWEFPTVSMGLGPLNAIYQARFNRYLHNRGIKDTSDQRVWFFGGDGETAEPETLGALAVAAREGLDNLTFVINCNLQQLDGPVRGNGKIIQELEGVFRGAGWNVLKVVWGREWDELLARDVDGVLVARMNEVPDGQFQTYTVKDGSYIRDDFFGTDDRLLQMVEHLSDEEIERLPRGGHDLHKVYAAMDAATQATGCADGDPGPHDQGLDAGAGLRGPQRRPPDEEAVDRGAEALPRPARHRRHRRPAGVRPAALRQAGRGLRGAAVPQATDASSWAARCPTAGCSSRSPSCQPAMPTTSSSRARATRRSPRPWRWCASSRTSSSSRATDGKRHRQAHRADHPRRGPHVRDGLAVPDAEDLRPARARTFEPVDRELLLSYKMASDGQMLHEGITEAGSMASFHAAGRRTPPTASRWCRCTSSTRCSASSGPATRSGRPPTSAAAAS